MTGNQHRTFVYVGLAGEGENIGQGGLYRLEEGEEKWEPVTNGLPENPQVRALLIHPENPKIIYAGTNQGPYRSDDRGDSWHPMGTPRDGMNVWSLAFRPHNTQVIYAGYEPFGIYRSEDGGQSWQETDTSRVGFPDVTTYMPPLAKRVIDIAFDTSMPSDAYAAIEVGGLLATRDGGDSWDSITDGLYISNNTVDLHGVEVNPVTSGLLFIITQVAMFRSRDRGVHWEHVRFGEMFPGGSYCRDLVIAPNDPKTMFLAAGAGGGGAPAGTEEAGALFQSNDSGETWKRVDIGEVPPSRMFQVAIDPLQPSQMYCCTGYGHIFSSHDHGVSWSMSQLPVALSRGRHIYPMVCG